MAHDMLDLTATAAIAALQKKDLRLIDYVDALLDQSARLAPLNAFVTLRPDQVRDAARKLTKPQGPLFGLPYVLKDNINTRDLPTTACTPALQNWLPPHDAPIARALKENGGLLLGKTGMHELAFGVTGNNRHYGAVRNPYDPARTPGGSSSGTAAAIAARMAPAGIGTDTGGSCRIPAAMCGCAGFRPTLARYDASGIVPLSSTRDTPGPLARTVEDIILFDGICAVKKTPPAHLPSLKGIRLGVPRGYFYDDLHPETVRHAEQALAHLREAGAVLVESDLPDIAALNAAVGFPVVLFESVRELGNYLYVNGASLSIRDLVAGISSRAIRQIMEGIAMDGGLPAEAYRAVLTSHRPRLQAAYADYFRRNDLAAMLVPATPLPAPLHRPFDEDGMVELNGKEQDLMLTFIRNSDPPSNAGLPALTVPVGLTRDGLPVGIEFVGPEGMDATLLAIGHAYETLRPALPAPG